MQALARRRDLRVGVEALDDPLGDAAECITLADTVIQVYAGVGVGLAEDETDAVTAVALYCRTGVSEAAPGR